MAAAVHRNDRSFAFEWNLAIVQYADRAESELVPLRVCVCVTFFEGLRFCHLNGLNYLPFFPPVVTHSGPGAVWSYFKISFNHFRQQPGLLAQSPSSWATVHQRVIHICYTSVMHFVLVWGVCYEFSSVGLRVLCF